MKKHFKNVSFMILLLHCCVFFAQGENASRRIVIDPGHGGFDSGALSQKGAQEKDIVLSVAKKIIGLNERLERPLEIYLTRYTDTLISLSDRTRLARKLQADLFISLHCNHSENPNARGVEIYIAKRTSSFSADATYLAFQLQKGLKNKIGFESRGVKFSKYQVLLETITYCSSVLLELGFLSNEDEGGYISDAIHIQSIAAAILHTIQKK